MQDLLDDELLEKTSERFKWYRFTALYFVTILNLYTVVFLGSRSIILWCSLAFMLTLFILTWKNHRVGATLTLILLFVASLVSLELFPIVFYFKIASLRIDLLILLLAIIHYFCNKAVLGEVLSSMFFDLNEEEIKRKNRITETNKVNTFVKKYSDKSIKDLELIVENSHMTKEARAAAKILLMEKVKISKSK